MRCDRKHFLLHPCTWPAWPHHWAPAGCSLPIARAWFPAGPHHSYRAKTHCYDESSSLSKDPPTQSRNSLTANSQIRLWMYFISNKFVHPQTFSRNPPSQILLLSRVQSSIRMGAPRMGGASANRAHPHSPVQIPQSLSSARPYNAL